MRLIYILIAVTNATLCLANASFAQTATAYAPTSNMFGALGLNTTPNARMEDTGTIRLGTGTSDPYLHGYASMQISKPLNVTLRQTARTSDINSDPDRFYPGIDLRLRLMEETTYKPSVVLGLQSATGHKRMAAEYLVASKRYNDFDFSFGAAWGRLGSAAHLSNPLKVLGGHFAKERDLRSESPNGPDDWFTGEDIGLFAGVEYFTPYNGLSLKADWGADRYIVEQTQDDFNPPDPWSVGVSLATNDHVHFGASILGGQKIMGTINIKSPLERWPFRSNEKKAKTEVLNLHRTEQSSPASVKISADSDNIDLTHTNIDGATAATYLQANTYNSMPQQIGNAAIHVANHAGPDVEEIRIKPRIYGGLRGPTVRLMRKDLERAIGQDQGSAEEIWHNTRFEGSTSSTSSTSATPQTEDDNDKTLKKFALQIRDRYFKWVLDNDLSLSEEDSGLLYRSGLLFESTVPLTNTIIAGNSIRVNLGQNLTNLPILRGRSSTPVRSDIDRFAAQPISLENAYLGYLDTFSDDIYIAALAGKLEEMYSGYGGEVLYRPFGRTYAFGAEAYHLFKHDPNTNMNLGLTDQNVVTAHANAYYEVPDTNMTLGLKIGRYLAEDIGGTIKIQNRFSNGARMEGFITATDQSDPDLFGDNTHLHSGIKLVVPVGSIPYVPEGSEARFKVSQLGRDTGQSLQKPIDLYDTTNALSYRHFTQHWNEIVD